eukprot:5840770-Pyramimonas_sp.AAC.2
MMKGHSCTYRWCQCDATSAYHLHCATWADCGCYCILGVPVYSVPVGGHIHAAGRCIVSRRGAPGGQGRGQGALRAFQPVGRAISFPPTVPFSRLGFRVLGFLTTRSHDSFSRLGGYADRREHGYFDGDGNYVEYKVEKHSGDSWLEGVKVPFPPCLRFHVTTHTGPTFGQIRTK